MCYYSENYEIVVAYYDEDLSWLSPYTDHCHIYQKGSKQIEQKTAQEFRQWDTLPNVGRESHTYLHHIITNYDCLAEVTIFFQGDIKSHLCWRPFWIFRCNPDIDTFVGQARDKGFYTPIRGLTELGKTNSHWKVGRYGGDWTNVSN